MSPHSLLSQPAEPCNQHWLSHLSAVGHAAIYDGALVGWYNKLPINAVRPVSVICYLYHDTNITAYAGPYQGTKPLTLEGYTTRTCEPCPMQTSTLLSLHVSVLLLLSMRKHSLGSQESCNSLHISRRAAVEENQARHQRRTLL
ncbi:hypothetical protein CEUSTIGMA_g13218.t1 [Chlamydomonas eustigma]|uniref:Uncharacterized protein n=1 Tax=Chlamydomonas eustigma TaxID=1157962 RepID=A0A250XS12_9CHLO|nr:hypothetical protein CEUSTIGMA_g13218.t1 [Chlamydomonas eustigma]|eukprot:GAX85803.1 hypothetical protein CEUSTIGMA_g13218.t1 [Chlamydomonas eustigma]